MFDILCNSVKKYQHKSFHGRRVGNAYEWKTYEQVFDDVRAFGSGLIALGALVPDVTNEMKLLGLMGRNHSDWMIAEYACFGFSGTTVPFYDTLSSETLCHLINNCGLSTVVCDEPSARRLIQAKAAGAESLKLLIVYGTDSKDQVDAIATLGKEQSIQVMDFTDVLALGSKKLLLFNPPKSDDIISFVFTSGSTGKFPKAALIRHSSSVSNVTAVIYEYDNTPNFGFKRGEEYYLSYLPCAHAMERLSSQLIMSVGGAIAYSQGIRKRVMEEIALLRPTLFICVPRILNRLHDKIVSTALVAGWPKANIFSAALEKKKEGVAQGYLKHPFYDAVVFEPIKKKIGLDRCTRIITGSAPISAEVLGFYRAVFGSKFV